MSADDEMSSLDRSSDSRAPAREPVSDRRSEAPTGSHVSGGGTSVARRSVSREGMALHSGSGLHRLAVATAGATLVLLFLGGLVTSTGSGLAVPDWPLSFGQVFPPMVGGVLFEHGHRLVAACVGLLTVTLLVLLSHWEPRAWVRWLARGAVLAVLLQGALGGVTVLFRLPLAVSVTHACLAQAFLCLVVTLAVCTAPGWQARPASWVEQKQPALRVLAVVTAGMVYLQLILGALMRHMGAGLAIPDFPLAFGRLLPPLD